MNLPELSTNALIETIIAFVALIIITGLLTLQILLKISDVYAVHENPPATVITGGSR